MAPAALVSASTTLQLTYASLYAVEYGNITFWHLLDYISIDAYFPLATVDDPSPSVAALTQSWLGHLADVDAWRAGAGLQDKVGVGLPSS